MEWFQHATWFTIGEVAQGLKISEREVRKMCLRGLLPGAEHFEGAWTIPRSAIIRYLRSVS